jgi:multicomponent Na+:H+ antiporter subunit E
MHYAITAVVLSGFWLVLSGHFTSLLLSLGAVSVLLATWLLARMDRADGEVFRLRPTPRLLTYALWLLWGVVRANIDVARRIWDPDLPLAPVWTRLDTSVGTPLQKTVYANSITLTPGTLTTDVEPDHFLVHALTPAGIEELREGEMERRIRRLGV